MAAVVVTRPGAMALGGANGRPARGHWERISAVASPWLSVLGLVALALSVLATMLLTSFDRLGTVFLGGVLTASVLATLSQAANARWTLARRTAQLAAIRARLARESSARGAAERSLERLRERERLVDECLPAMLAYVGADGRLRYHNRAYARWLKLPDAAIEGHCVEEVLGEATFREVAPRLQEAFAGRDVRYERVQRMRDGTPCHLLVQYFPRYLAHGEVDGVFALLTDTTNVGDVSPLAACAQAANDPVARLRSALDDDEFTLHYQPIASLDGADGTAMGEVLLRLNEEEEKHLPPGGFIPLADELGLLHELDRWVVRHVIDLAAADRDASPIFLVSLWRQSVLDEAFAPFVRERLATCGADGRALCFEFPEADVLQHRAAYLAFADRLREAGCRFAISEFGRDERGTEVAKALRAEYVKLDAGLVLGMLRSPDSMGRLKAAVERARRAELVSIAECVESDTVRAALARLGVRFAQGFGIARPRPIESGHAAGCISEMPA